MLLMTAPTAERTKADVETVETVEVKPRRSTGRFVFRALAVAMVAATVTVLVVELRHTDLRATFSHIHMPYVFLAVAAIAISVVAAGYNLLGFAPLRLRLMPTLLAQLAVSAIRVVAPSAVSTPAIATRYLTRSGATMPDALATVGIAQTVQFVVTIVLLGSLGLASSWHTVFDIGSFRLSLLLAGALLVYLLGWLAIRLSARAARGWAHARQGVASVVKHARAHPGLAAAGIVASAALTASHIAAFVFCVWAAGGHASIMALATVYLGSITAGSVIPTPGGTGTVEAAMITGLTVAGVPLAAATAATLLSRLISVWILVPPGWLALITMRRRSLL
jgi:uncharacterized membrane protein YbhN (UPF0104 family)